MMLLALSLQNYQKEKSREAFDAIKILEIHLKNRLVIGENYNFYDILMYNGLQRSRVW
jgi:hypothetical protein